MISPMFKLNAKEAWVPQPVETAERLASIDGRRVDLAKFLATGGGMNFPHRARRPRGVPDRRPRGRWATPPRLRLGSAAHRPNLQRQHHRRRR